MGNPLRRYFDNHYMLSMFRGGPVAWMTRDAEKISVQDGEWIEV